MAGSYRNRTRGSCTPDFATSKKKIREVRSTLFFNCTTIFPPPQMASTLGKRKRSGVSTGKENLGSPSSSPELTEQDAQEIFRRHFESQFKPLPATKRKTAKPIEVQPEDEDDASEESDWEGISDDDGGVQVVEHTEKRVEIPRMSKTELKAFMVRLELALFFTNKH